MSESSIDKIMEIDRSSVLPGLPDANATITAIEVKASFAKSTRDANIHKDKARAFSTPLLLITSFCGALLFAKALGNYGLVLIIPSVQLIALGALIKEDSWS